MYPYILQGNSLTIVVDNETHNINTSHYAYQKIIDAIKSEEWSEIKSILNPEKVILEYGEGNISIKGEELYWKDELLNNSLSNRIIWMLSEGFPITPMVKFLDNLKKNPSNRAVNELYTFMERNTLPITEDGCFLAYKLVTDDYFDPHSHSVPNKPRNLWTQEEIDTLPMKCGIDKTVTVAFYNDEISYQMRRNNVDDNFKNHCSSGLHFCSKEYFGEFTGSRVVVLKINPRDVVSIPDDYNFSKGRCSRYQVIDELKGKTDTKLETRSVQ